jgi:hypothetical protein
MIKYEPPRRKSVGEQAKDMVVFLLTVGAIYLVLYWIFRIITAPFRILFMSDGQKLEAKIKNAKDKVARREAIRERYAEDENNPMNQYINRFKLYEKEYSGDHDNEEYRVWFDNLKNGTILDTKLRWAPDVYRTTTEGKAITEEFLDYFARQVSLHVNGSISLRMAFMKTIRDLYPEFTPMFSALPAEIEELRERSRARKLYLELTVELEKKGVPKELGSELLKMNLGLEKLREAIVAVNKGLSRGYSEEMCFFCVRKNIDLDDPFVEAVGGTISNVLDKFGDEAIATALITQEVSPEEIGELVNLAVSMSDDTEEQVDIISMKFRELMKNKCAEELSGRG